MSASPLDFQIVSADYEPEDLSPQLPCHGTLVREIPGSDRPDYWLASLDAPLTWKDGDSLKTIRYLILAPRYVDERIQVPFPDRITVGIAYVLDESLIEDVRLNFDKCKYAAIGEARCANDA